MKKVVIVGGGFAGLNCVHHLRRSKQPLDITLVDCRADSQFLPLLPDIIARNIDTNALSLPFEKLSRNDVSVVLKKVVEVKTTENKVICADSTVLAYDYLVLSAGAEPNFYNNEEISRSAQKFYNIDDTLAVLNALHDSRCLNVVVVGGGYTGVELSCALKRYCDEHKLVKRIIIIERDKSVVSSLHPWMRDYVYENLKLMDIKLYTDCAISMLVSDIVSLNNGVTFDRAYVVWVAGVKAVNINFDASIKYAAAKRIVVDEYLQILPGIFCAGDMAGVYHKGSLIRMGIQSALTQGALCADNIVALTQGSALKKYKYFDPGFIVPMANDRACGVVLGFNVRGALAQFLHYMMCIYRSWSPKGRLAIFKAIFKS